MTTELRLAREAREARQLRQEQTMTTQEKAIDILYRDYKDRLTDADFLDAVVLVETENKARVFIALREGDRDRWLQKNISAELYPYISD